MEYYLTIRKGIQQGHATLGMNQNNNVAEKKAYTNEHIL